MKMIIYNSLKGMLTVLYPVYILSYSLMGSMLFPCAKVQRICYPDIQIKSLICLAWSMNISQAQTD